MTALHKPPPYGDLTIEYHVFGELDGTTLAPDIDLDPSSEGYNEPDERGIHVVTVQGNLGLIDPDGIGPAVQGDRCIPWVFLDSPVVGGFFTSMFAVLDNVDRSNGIVVPSLQRIRFFTLGAPDFYSARPTRIPQGSVLGILDYPASGRAKILRINIVAPQNAMEYAAILEACCCADQVCIDPPELLAQDPLGVQRTGQTVTFTFTGTNLIRPGGAPVEVIFAQVTDGQNQPATGGFVRGTFVTGTSTSITLDFALPADLPSGGYRAVALDAGDPTCNSFGLDELSQQIFWEANCPLMDDPQPGSPFVLDRDAGVQTFNITGSGFGTAITPLVSQINLLHQGVPHTMKNVTFAVVNDTTIQVTTNPTSTPPVDLLGFYDIQMVPTDPGCPTQRIFAQVTLVP